MPDVRDSFAAATRNPISQLGSALALVSGVLILTLFTIEVLGFEANPYVGIITYMILPVVFALERSSSVCPAPPGTLRLKTVIWALRLTGPGRVRFWTS